MKHNRIGSIIFSALILLAVFARFNHAQVAERLLPFQGRVTDAAGKSIPDGVRLMRFQIYSLPSGGNLLWEGEDHRVTINSGLVNVLLGTRNFFPRNRADRLEKSFFDQPLYLQITIAGENENAIGGDKSQPPLLPRQSILPVVFAHEAADSRTLSGYDWKSVFGTNDPSGKIDGSKLTNITSAAIAPQTITSNQIGSGAIDLANLAQQVADALNPPGTIIAYAGNTNSTSQLPSGWLLCDGSAVSSVKYPRLFKTISTNWGAGYTLNGTSWIKANDFNLPDLRGMFLRGVVGTRTNFLGRPVDLDVLRRTNAIPGGLVGNFVGSAQFDQFEKHRHRVVPPVSYDDTSSGKVVSGGSSDMDQSANFDTEEAGGAETRPKNVYVHYLIKI